MESREMENKKSNNGKKRFIMESCFQVGRTFISKNVNVTVKLFRVGTICNFDQFSISQCYALKGFKINS